MKISELSDPVGYQAALVRASLHASIDHTASDDDLDDAATEAGLRPAAFEGSSNLSGVSSRVD
ncbi:hypothetical protein [Streptomyces sp. NPDC057375]|uniref:hypothetical protein n=1 Tax=Streptomyces sp. NPDC057375 TaxID=3346109 RepID=UPI0036257FD4